MKGRSMNAYAALKITDAHPCPHCGAITGHACATETGTATRNPHVLRVNAAKRAAVREEGPMPCPAGCGDDLILGPFTGLAGTRWIVHVRTSRFECGAAL